MPHHNPALLAVVALASACDPWRAPNELGYDGGSPLWSPASAVALTDGVYVLLPATGGLVRIRPDGTYAAVDVGDARVTRLDRGADGTTLVAFVERYTCEDEDVVRVDDCDGEELDVTQSLAVVRDGAVGSEVALDAPFNALGFSADGRWAFAFFDFDRLDLSDLGVVSLNSVLAIDLQSGDTTPVSVGFDADRVLFTYEASGDATRAVVLSQSSVAVIDLLGASPARTTTFPLTLDADVAVTPADVSLTPDGQFALISTTGGSDLYALDLVNESIRIVELGGTPGEMATDPIHDVTLLTYTSGPFAVDVLDNQSFEITRYDLEERTDRVEIAEGAPFALLWGEGVRDLYRLDLDDGDITEYRLVGGAESVSIVPGGQVAVVTTSAGVGGTAGMELLDLLGDDTAPYSLEGAAVGVAFTEVPAGTDVLLLQDGIDYLFRLNLGSGLTEEVELPAPPVAIGAVPDGPFYITHTTGTGLVSFLGADGELTTASGFGTIGLLDTLNVTREGK